MRALHVGRGVVDNDAQAIVAAHLAQRGAVEVGDVLAEVDPRTVLADSEFGIEVSIHGWASANAGVLNQREEFFVEMAVSISMVTSSVSKP